MKLRNKMTGEILEDVKYIDTSLNTIEIHYLDNGILRMETEKDYHSFLQNWEDYKPTEPLIKDEKVRKAVRAWAEVNKINECKCTEESHCVLFETERGMFISFEYAEPIPPEGDYTIAELCGEEEE